VFGLTGNADEVEIAALDPADPPEPYGAPLLRIAEEALVP
jgi:hypothetical protein